jgi:hypothetical protein
MASLKYFNTITNQWEVIKTDGIDSVIPNKQTWTATTNQSVFTISNGLIPDVKLLSVYVDGKIRTDYSLTNSTTFTFFTGLTSGQQVFAEWFEVSVPATTGHHSIHEINGQDQIDVTRLLNYSEQIETPINNLQTDNATNKINISDLQTNLTNHENNTSNPHAVTASQVGAYSKSESDNLLAVKISGNGYTRVEGHYAQFFTNGTSTTAYATITFTNAFTNIPDVFPGNIVQATAYSDVIYYPFIYGVTTTGFNVRLNSIGSLGEVGDPRNIFMAFFAIGN